MIEHVRRSANRFELKYLVPHDRAAAFIAALTPYVRPDAHAADHQGYAVYSVYWDSDDFALFWEKIEGLKDRRKLRVRRYEGADYGFVEIKHRTDRTLEKRRVRLGLDDLYRWFREPGSDAWPEDDPPPVVSEALHMRERLRLRPRVAISYRRRAFFGAFEPDLRITFDRWIQYDTRSTDIAAMFDQGRYVVDPRVVVMEVKYSDRAPLWLCGLVSSFGLQMTRLSKYCTAVDQAYFGSRLT